MNNPASAAEKNPQPGPSSRRQLLILSIASGAILVFIAVAILVYLLFRGTGQPSAGTPTPAETMEATITTSATPMLAPSCETIISSGDVEVGMALPVSLTAKNAVYPVEPIIPQEEAWTYPTGRSGQAVWVCGTVINYVVGLEPTAENEELVRNLAPGDEIRLQMSSGTVLLFRFVERRDTAPGGEVALAQQKPSLTLVLPKTDTWQIAMADYAAEAESMAPPPAEMSAQLGQPVEADQTRVTVVEGDVKESDDIPQGTVYYVTEFSVENLGEAPIATDAFSMRLRDSLGNTYLVSPQASEAGESGPLSGEVEPGASAQGSAGYIVPDPLPAGELTWIFSPRPGAEEVTVSIPHEGGTAGDGLAVQPEVTITDAFLSNNGTILLIEGEVLNGGAQALVVEPTDVTLSSSAGMSELVMAAPSLPWTIEPGQRQVIELQYPRPDASTVLLELLGYSFEIGGLQ